MRDTGEERAAKMASKGEGFLLGAGREFANLGRGIGQTVGLVSREDVAEARKRDAPISEMPGATAGAITAGAASALPTMFVPGANTVAGATALGGLWGALQPSVSTNETVSNIAMSGGMSGAITGAAKSIPSLYNAFVSPFTKSGRDRIALDTIARFAKDPNALSKANLDELVVGSRPTLAEATGDPGIAQLQRSAQAASPETANLLAQNRTSRMGARRNALLDLAGSADDRLMFEEARDATAAQLYGKAFKTPFDPKTAKALAPEIKALMARPSIREAQQIALEKAKESGAILKASDVKGGSIEGMHYMKRALDDMISSAKRAGENDKVRLLMGTKDKFMGVMQNLSPQYAKAVAEYEAASKPLNRMEVGRYMYDKLIPALSDLGAERITPQAFAKALKDGDEMAKKATGFSGAKLRDVLTDQDVDMLVKMGLDLGREARAMEMARVPGSPTAQYLAGSNAMRQIMGPLGLPEKWSESVLAKTLGGRAISAAGAPVEASIQARLAEMLADPRVATQAASNVANARRASLIPLSKISKYGLPPVSVGGGSVYATQE